MRIDWVSEFCKRFKNRDAALNHIVDLLDEHEDGSFGLCLSCDEEAWGVEPDARNYKCEACGAKAVFGLEEILLEVG